MTDAVDAAVDQAGSAGSAETPAYAPWSGQAVIVWLQQQFSLVMISPTLAYPVAITPMNTLIVFATIVVLGLLASLVASSRVKNRMK